MASPASPRSQYSDHSQHSSAYGAPVVQSPRPTMDNYDVHNPSPEELLATRSRMTQNPPLSSIRPDAGYLMKGWRRKLVGEGEKQRWVYVNDDNGAERDDPPGPETEYTPPDIYADKVSFPDDETIVQIVTFRTEEPQPAKWHRPLTKPDEIYETLKKPPVETDEWRLILCEGFHGPSMRAVAQGTGWNERKFGGIFTWTRASMEWADDVLLVHFNNQGTRIFVWYGGGNYKHLIMCSTLNPTNSSVTRIRDFIDRGCSRPEIVLRRDPSIMFYGIVRAVIQDLRYSVHEIHKSMGDAYRRGISQPSRDNLAYFYHLQDRLSVLSLDTTSLKSAAMNLCETADKMHLIDEERIKVGKGPLEKRLISERARFMLRDQMGLIKLLDNELPDISNRAEAIVNLAFNTLAFGTNNLLQVLAVITLASIPLTVATGILGINYFDSTKVTGTTIVITLATVATFVVVCVIAYIVWFFWKPAQTDDGSDLSDKSKRKQTAQFERPALQNHAQRATWARMQDLLRDNEIIAQQNQLHPLRREFHDVSSPGPRQTTLPVPVTQPPPPHKRKTAFKKTTRMSTERVASPTPLSPLSKSNTWTNEPVSITEEKEDEKPEPPV